MKQWGRRAGIGAGITGWLLAVALGFDQLGNAILGGDPDMTISTSCGLRIEANAPTAMRWLFCEPVCAVLHVIDRNHCADARE